MRKVLVVGLLLTAVIYALPIFCGYAQPEPPLPIPQDGVPADAEIAPAPQGSPAAQPDCPPAPTITVLVGDTVREMDLEHYTLGVTAGEIAPDFPTEALRAQAVAARTYAVYQQQMGRPAQHENADVCDNPAHCAAFVDLETPVRWGEHTNLSAIRSAVRDTAGQVLTYQGKPVIAVFSAAAGEKSERAADVWGCDIPYLQSVESPGGAACPQYYGAVTWTADEIRTRAAKTFPAADLSGDPAGWFKASERSPAGGVTRVRFGGINVEGTALRSLLALNSTNFTVHTQGDRLTFQTVGYGHGVGLSQWGAKYAAEQGQTYAEILAHYYPGTKLEQLYKPSEAW